MSWIEIIADRKIRDAQEEGAFDNLPGKGKPLKLDFDPNVPPEMRAAYRLMKEAQILPDWIQLDKEVRTFQQQLQERLEESPAGGPSRSSASAPPGRREPRFELRKSAWTAPATPAFLPRRKGFWS